MIHAAATATQATTTRAMTHGSRVLCPELLLLLLVVFVEAAEDDRPVDDDVEPGGSI